MENKKPLIVIAGPTASGKTSAGIALAKKIGGEIISADSMQVYKYMDIGSAKVKKEEMEGIPHHLIDVLDPKEEFNVTVFKRLAEEALSGIYERGNIPIVAGGTGFYIQALVRDIDFTENTGDKSYRRLLEEKARKEGGPEYLHRLLSKKDPLSAERIPVNNVKRVIRALEFYEETGIPISVHNDREKEKESPYDLSYFVLSPEREILYKRIDERVDRMMEEGLLEETRFLMDYGCQREMTSMQGLGYKQLYAHLLGEMSLAEAVDEIKLQTRHFAKRQLTWFRREAGAVFTDPLKENLTDVFEIRHNG